MTKKYVKSSQEPVEILVVADRSGSMASIKEDAIGGFNTFLKEQQQVEGEANLTLVLFDDQYEVPVTSTPVGDVLPLTESTYVPRGMTALNDAIGKAVNTLKEKNPTHAIICILTDGMENASKEYTNASVKDLMKEAEKKDWEVVYLAANQDAFKEGVMRGITNNINFAATSKGISDAYTNMSVTASTYRSRAASNTEDNNNAK